MNAVSAITLAGVAVWAGSLLLGAVSPATSAAVIGLWEYLIPEAPTLTQRYLPSRAMAYSKHGSTQTAPDPHPKSANVNDHDRDNALVEHDTLVSYDSEVNLCLTDAVRHVWTDTLDAIDADVDAALSESAFVGAESSEFAIDGSAGNFAVSVDGACVDRWPSHKAFLADTVGAVALANELPGQHRLSSRTRNTALGELRLLLDRCPTRGDGPDFQHRTETTCYQTQPVTTMQCAGYDTSFIEAAGA